MKNKIKKSQLLRNLITASINEIVIANSDFNFRDFEGTEYNNKKWRSILQFDSEARIIAGDATLGQCTLFPASERLSRSYFLRHDTKRVFRRTVGNLTRPPPLASIAILLYSLCLVASSSVSYHPPSSPPPPKSLFLHH